MVGSAWTLFHLMISNLKCQSTFFLTFFCSIPSIFAGHNSHGIVPRNAGCDRALSRMCPLQVPKRSPWMVHTAVVFRSPLQRVFLTACGYAVKRTTFLQPEFDFLMGHHGPSWSFLPITSLSKQLFPSVICSCSPDYPRWCTTFLRGPAVERSNLYESRRYPSVHHNPKEGMGLSKYKLSRDSFWCWILKRGAFSLCSIFFSFVSIPWKHLRGHPHEPTR